MTPIDKLSRNHYPRDTSWVKNSTYTNQLYKNNPYIRNTLLPHLEILEPATGILECKLGDTISFSIIDHDPPGKIQINSNVDHSPRLYRKVGSKRDFNETGFLKQKYINYKTEDDKIKFDYIINNKAIYYIEILFDYNLAIKYLVKVN